MHYVQSVRPFWHRGGLVVTCTADACAVAPVEYINSYPALTPDGP